MSLPWQLLIPAAVAAVATIAVEVANRWSRRGNRQSHGESRWATDLDTRHLGRLSTPNHMHPDGIVLGFFGRRLLQTPAEDNALVFGVQRSGKTSTVAVPSLLAWGGAAVATSIKHELVALTAHHRSRLGPVQVFAPLDADHDWSTHGAQAVTWNPIAEVHQPHHAVELADLLTASGKQGASAHWYHSASSLLAGLILAEHAVGGDLRSVLARLNRMSLTEYVGLAQEQSEPVAQELLMAFAQTPEREAGSIASTARSCLSLWMDSRVAGATSSDAHGLDVDRLLSERGTLYLVAPAEEAVRLRPLFSALIQTILRRATARARDLGGTMAPRLLLALDEIANFAHVPSLAGHVSSGPGQGLQWLLCFHDLAQLQSGYGALLRILWRDGRPRWALAFATR